MASPRRILLLSILVLGAAIAVWYGCNGAGSSAPPRMARAVDEIPSDQLELERPSDPFPVVEIGFESSRDTRHVVKSQGVREDSIEVSDAALRLRTVREPDKPSWIDIAVDAEGVGVDAARVTEILVDVWRSDSHTAPKLAWTTEVGGRTIAPRSPQGTKLEPLFTNPKTKSVLYSLRVDRMSEWRGKIRSIRFWPGNHPDLDVAIRGIRLMYSHPLLAWYKRNLDDRAGKAEIASETRVAILAHPPSRYEMSVKVPKDGRLAFGHGILESGTRTAPETTFRVIAQDRAGSATLFRATLHPAVSAKDSGWHDMDINLARYSGREITLAFETESAARTSTESAARTSTEGEEFSPAVWSDPVVYDAGLREDDTNVVLISLDTLRGDHLGGYGHDRATSPNFDRFAKENVFFEKLTGPAASTGPSHMTLFLSLHPTKHGIVNHERRLADRARTMAEIYRDAGYTTGAFTESGYITAGIGFHQGFSTYAEVLGSMKDRGGYVDETFPRSIEWLKRCGNRPFFLFVQTYQCHVPYCPGVPFDDMFYPEYDGVLDRCLGYKKLGQMNYEAIGYDFKDKKNHGKRPPTPEDIDHVLAMYDAEIRKTDMYLGRLLDSIEELGLADDTIVVIFSDHGEDFLDHLAVGRHARSLYDEMLRVPLAIRIPGSKYGSRIVRERVAMVDLLPTLLELTNVRPTKQESAEFEGRSIVPLLEGRELSPTDIFAENYSMANRAAIVRGEWKFIETREFENPEKVAKYDDRTKRIRGLALGEELYHLADDPGEQRNVVQDHPEIANELREALRAMLDKQESEALGASMRDVDGANRLLLIDLGYIDEDPLPENGDDADRDKE